MDNLKEKPKSRRLLKGMLIIFSLCVILASIVVGFGVAFAHQSGCHRWHSCPSDSGSYVCGDSGHPCQYPTYPASGGVIYPPSGYYKDCYDCPLKEVPTNDSRTWKKTLERGMNDVDVIYLQKALNKEGIYPEAIYSGYYGSLTEHAVKLFQRKYNIVSSGTPFTTGYGRVGWATMAKLNELYILEK